MWRVLCLLTFPFALAAESKWIQARSGPVEIYSDAGNKIALEKLGAFEQFRFALGTLVGKPDLNAEPAIRLLAMKNPTLPSALNWGRDRIAIPISADRPIPASVYQEATRVLLEQNVARLPPDIEKGLEDFISTIEVRGTKVVWGAPPAPAERTRDWARIQLLATKPDYYGKLRIVMFNLLKGIDADPAYRNAIGKSKKEFDAELDAYFQAGVFSATDAPSRPMNAQRDVPVKLLDAGDVELAMADLLNADSRAEYEKLLQDKRHFVDACEGLAVLALRAKDEATALKYLRDATDAGTKSAAAWLEYAKLETDRPRSNDAIEQALELDPKLAEAHFLKGDRKHDLDELKKATSLNPRRWEYWNSLAEAYLDNNQFPEAAKAYRAAERAAGEPADKEKMRKAWARIETEKLDYRDSEKRRVADDDRLETQRLKDKALADLHASEARINQKLGSTVASEKAIPWNEAGLPIALEGVLKQVDCLGKDTRVVIESVERQTIKLALKDRGKLTCGAQDGRRVSVEYLPKPDAKLGTAGELASLPE